LNCDISIALFPVALDVHVVQGEVRQLLHSPVCEHDPRHDRVEQEDESVGNTCSDTSQLSVRDPKQKYDMRTCSHTSHHRNRRRRCR
jgi:hypothetical protein